MRHIIVPTDFSPTANHAMHYAVMLALKMDADIHFVHAYDFPQSDPFRAVFSTKGDPIATKELQEEYVATIEKELAYLVDKVDELTQGRVKATSTSVAGLPVDEAVAGLPGIEHSYVVMGTKGHTNRAEFLMGSHAAAMVESCPVPVIVVPKDAPIDMPGSVVFASGLLERDMEPLRDVIRLITPWKADLHLLHLDDKADTEGEQAAMEGYKEIVYDHVAYPNLHFHLIKESQVIEGINESASEHQANLIVMNSQRRTGIASWFKRSLSKRMVFHTHLPLLVYHS